MDGNEFPIEGENFFLCVGFFFQKELTVIKVICQCRKILDDYTSVLYEYILQFPNWSSRGSLQEAFGFTEDYCFYFKEIDVFYKMN